MPKGTQRKWARRALPLFYLAALAAFFIGWALSGSVLWGIVSLGLFGLLLGVTALLAIVIAGVLASWHLNNQ